MIPVLIFVAGLIGLYYLYLYLFGPKTGVMYPLVTVNQSANVDATKPIDIASDKLPLIYEGGEFTISSWIYINNWSYRSMYNKSIISLGGTNLDTLRIYLGGVTPTLNVRLHTRETGAATSGNPDNETENLGKETRDMTFTQRQTDSELTATTNRCDLPEVQLQRWVNITVAVNGKTVDVYMDGKLSRSCVLPTFYKVDSGYSAKLLGYGGFGGQISTTSMYDAALNPEAVYKIYMAGPQPINSFGDWLSAVFAPGVSISVTSS